MGTTRTIGVLGGSGLYDLAWLEDRREHRITTPFGEPSDLVVEGRAGDARFLFLPRHGRGHRVPPHRVRYRANVLALKMAGAEQLVSVSAVGSMKEAIRPGDVVLPDQFIDRTTGGATTYFDDEGVVAHVGLADPVDPALSGALYRSAVDAGIRAHRGGTYVCIEGPQFSTRAESHLYRSWGVDVVGMTAVREARLAREAELPFSVVALATDYDCWHVDEAPVSAHAVVEALRQGSENARRILQGLARTAPDPALSPAIRALDHAVLTPRDAISPDALARLRAVSPRYFERRAEGDGAAQPRAEGDGAVQHRTEGDVAVQPRGASTMEERESR